MYLDISYELNEIYHGRRDCMNVSIANFCIRAFTRKLARMVSDSSGATFLCSANLYICTNFNCMIQPTGSSSLSVYEQLSPPSMFSLFMQVFSSSLMITSSERDKGRDDPVDNRAQKVLR